MQLKTTVSSHYTLTRMSKIKKMTNTKCWQVDRITVNFLPSRESVNLSHHIGKSYVVPTKNKHISHDLAISLPDICPQE